MSHTLWLQTSDGVSRGGGDQDHSIMLRLSGALDALAERLGLIPLSAFHDHSALAREYASELGDLGATAMAEPERWHDSARGLMTVDGLLGELRERPESLAFSPTERQTHWVDALICDLADCRSRLQEAAAH